MIEKKKKSTSEREETLISGSSQLSLKIDQTSWQKMKRHIPPFFFFCNFCFWSQHCVIMNATSIPTTLFHHSIFIDFGYYTKAYFPMSCSSISCANEISFTQPHFTQENKNDFVIDAFFPCYINLWPP